MRKELVIKFALLRVGDYSDSELAGDFRTTSSGCKARGDLCFVCVSFSICDIVIGGYSHAVTNIVVIYYSGKKWAIPIDYNISTRVSFFGRFSWLYPVRF